MRVVRSAGLSDPGRVRRRNEDSYVCDPPLFAVADGMGGAQAGELASRIAASAFREAPDGEIVDPEARLRSVIQEANRRIYARAVRDPTVSGMGTTVTAALVDGDRVAFGHVGDSRAYRLRDAGLEQLTNDHSLVADLVRTGRLTPEEAQVHPQRSVITRALGTDPAVEIDSFSVEGLPGDVYLLCSDGLPTMVGAERLRDIVATAPSLDGAARSLVAAANAGGGEDNVTVVLFALAEGDPETPDEDTLSGLAVPPGLPEPPAAGPAPLPPAPGSNGRAQAPVRAAPSAPRREHRAGRALLVVAVVVLVFAAAAGAALWGLSRAHFVGATVDGRIAVYQGVPYEILGGVELYRETYVSTLQAAQLSPEERALLLDHDLVGEDEARARIARYEAEATPGTPPSS